MQLIRHRLFVVLSVACLLVAAVAAPGGAIPDADAGPDAAGAPDSGDSPAAGATTDAAAGSTSGEAAATPGEAGAGRATTEPEFLEAAAEPVFHIEGSGWGHGVGMSQYGALGMANAGFTAEQITGYYYRGTAVQSAAMPSDISVFLGEFNGAVGVFLQNPGAPLTYRTDNGLTTTQPAGSRSVVVNVGGLMRTWGPQSDAWVGATRVSIALDGTNPFLIEQVGNRFRYGRIDLIAQPNGAIRVIAAGLTMQQYMYGIAEVPSSWPNATLDAQALAARTYAFEKINRLGLVRPGCSCSLLGSQGDQVYVGYDKEGGFQGDRWRAAVDRTNGQFIAYGGGPIQAFYSSSNGGHTEPSEYAFASALPYLQAFPDPYDAASPDRRWVRDYTQSQLSRWLGASGDTAVGTVTRLEILGPLTPSGRVGRVQGPSAGGIRITGTAGTKQVSGGRFQTAVNAGVFGDGFGYDRSIKSTRFTIGGFAGADPSFRGGLYVTTGKFDNSGQDFSVVSNGPGAPPILRIYDTNGGLRHIFYSYETNFLGGFNSATCDIDGDGMDEIVTIRGPGHEPIVLIYEWDGVRRGGFVAGPLDWFGGSFIGCGDVDNDGVGEIVTGTDVGGAPIVRVFEANGTLISTFLAAEPTNTSGVRVATVDPDGPGGQPALLALAGGPGGDPWVKVTNLQGGVISQWLAFGPEFRGGVFIDGFDVISGPAEETITSPGPPGYAGGAIAVVRSLEGNYYTHVLPQGASGSGGGRAAGGRFPDKGLVVVNGPGTFPLVSILDI